STDDYDTIGGLVFGELGHVPEVGESVKVNELVFRVEELDGRRIQVIRISQSKK
ncbi:MAG: transporter associated domain-containing protein, partial [Ilumatobacteraceae bacterium]